MVGVLAFAPACDAVWGLQDDHRDAPLADDAVRSRYADAVLADEPSGYWRFSATDGPTALDVLGRSPGTYASGATPTATGALVEADTALALDGIGGFVSMGARFPFAGTLPFSIEAWVKPSRHGSFTGVLSEHDDSGALSRKGYFMYDDPGYFGFNRSDGTLNQETRTTPLPLDQWSYVAATYDGANLVLYVDGIMRATVTSPNVVIPTTSNPFVIGARNGGAFSFFAGAVDEVAIYPRALGVTQLEAHRIAAVTP